jgi:hypothetical protein
VRSERGQASVEWVGLLLLVALVLGALITRARDTEGRSLGELLAQRITCAGVRGCEGRRAGAAAPDRDGGAAFDRRDAATVAPPAAVVPVRTRGGPRALFRAGARKAVALNGLLCYLRESTAPGDTNRVIDDLGDAVNCLNPVDGWTGDVGGTDD